MAIINFNNLPDSLEPVAVSMLGTAVYDNIVFPAGKWITLEGAEIEYEEVRLDSVIMTVERSKNIIESHIAGKSGTVKEYFSTNDYTVTLSAIIAPELYNPAEIAQIAVSKFPAVKAFGSTFGVSPSKEPYDALGRVKAIDDVEESVPIESKFLNNVFGIRNVVIRSMKASHEAGDSFPISMVLVEDKTPDLGAFG